MPQGRIIVHCAYSGVGGTGSFVSELCPRLDSQSEHQSHVVFFGVEPVHPEFARHLNGAGISYKEVRKKRGLDLSSCRTLAQELRNIRPDIVVMHGGGSAWKWPLLRLLGVRSRMILVEHGPEYACTTCKGFLRHAIGLICADAVIAVSERLAKRLKETFAAILKGKSVCAIQNGVDTDFFQPPQKRSRTSGSLLMVGTLSPSKDHATLLRAVAILSKRHELTLHLAGNGSLRGELEKLATELGIGNRVRFHGNIGKAELLRLYQEAQIFTFVSKGEGSPLSLLEAMSCATPIVASDVPGVRELLANRECGILVPLSDPSSLASAIERVLEDPQLAHRIGTNARLDIQANNSATKMAESYGGILNGIC